MPIDQLVCIGSNHTYSIWHIQESEDMLLHQLDSYAAGTALHVIQHPIKRMEWLAARLAYQRLCQEANILYKPVQKDLRGRPYVQDAHVHISLSHSYPFAGAILSKHTPVGIDLQIPTTKLLGISPKYLTSAEIADSNQDLEKLCIYWCAKEAIYKAYIHGHCPSLAFIQIQPFNKALRGKLLGYTPSGHQYLVYYQINKSYILAWCEEQLSIS